MDVVGETVKWSISDKHTYIFGVLQQGEGNWIANKTGHSTMSLKMFQVFIIYKNDT
jgi:hypothetical protein